MSKREHYIDIAKGVAMVLVIIAHIKVVLPQVHAWINSFHMPLFFILSGLVFNPFKYDKFKDFFLHKVKTLIVPYVLLNIVLLFAMIIIDIKSYTITLFFERFLGIFIAYRLSNWCGKLWFVLVLFFAEILAYYISHFIGKITKEKRLNNLFMIIAIVITSVVGYVIINNIRCLFWYLDLVIFCTSFVLIGYLIKNNITTFNKMEKIYMIPVYAIVNLLFCYLNYKAIGKSSVIYNSVLGNYIFFMLSATAGSFLVIAICKAVRKNKVLEFIGKNTIIYYTFQREVCINLGMKLLLKLGEKLPIFLNTHVQVVVITIMSCIVLAGISYIITKYFPFIIGKKKEKNIATI